MNQIEAIYLSNAFQGYTFLNDQSNELLHPLSKINIFVGSNNSGKSRFMRLLSMQMDYKVRLNGIHIEQINSRIKTIIDRLSKVLQQYNFVGVEDIDDGTLNQLQSKLPNLISMKDDSYHEMRISFTRWNNLKNDNIRLRMKHNMIANRASERDQEKLLDSVRQLSKEALAELGHIPKHSENTFPKKVYIPVLRGLRPLDEQHTDLYAERTKRDYFSIRESVLFPEVFTGLSFYQRLMSMLLGSHSERKLISHYQEFISETLFEGRSVTLTPSLIEKAVIVKIGTEKEQPIYHLGDGIQTAIILSFLPFVMRDPTMFFIEEPEVHLHPGLQRKILEFFASCEEHTFFMTTHSNHFLDITIDIKEASVFTFRKHLKTEADNDEQIPTFTIEVVDTGDNSSLELLGVRNSSVFLVNATIWVEGITDRWYLRAMLESYVHGLREREPEAFKPEEDVHYCFVEYGGANITHWSFLDHEPHPIEVERLCARALVIVDQDGCSKLKRKEALESQLKERLIVLPCREVENLLPYKVIKKVVLDYEGTPEKEISDFAYEAYQEDYLGKFIEQKMLAGIFSRRGGYREDSGTIKAKVNFCERAVQKLTYAELPPTTQAVVEKIYEFIRSKHLQ